MHRRQLLIAGGSLLALSACAANGMSMSGADAPSAASLAEEARIARAVLPTQTPRAELLQPWTGPYGGVPAFDKVRIADFVPALNAAMKADTAEINTIANNRAKPTFDNTIAALERSGGMLDRVDTFYGVWSGTLSTPEMRAIEKEMSPKLSAHSDETLQNA